MNAVEWSINWWRERQAEDYFGKMIQHEGYRFHPVPDWFTLLALPCLTDTVLEIGCGYGAYMGGLAGSVKSITGVDIHPNLADLGNKRLKEEGIGNAIVMLGDGWELPFDDGQFDLIYSVSSFQHMPRQSVYGYLGEARRVCKEHGRGLFHFRYADVDGIWSADIHANHKGDFSVGWTAQEALQAGREAGWKEVQEHHGGDTLFLVTRD